ncbi:MAG: SulP family inorganic anion transporter [Myxococcales bacterium]|nr:SulP family inorganic anion transporter [Myxococcales bacterium]
MKDREAKVVAQGEPAPRFQVRRADFTAAITVALVGLPQCLAYAMMSGMPPAYGLATAAIPGFVAAIAGKSPHVVTGPTNTTGLLIMAALAPYLGDNGLIETRGLEALATLTLMAGVIRILAAYAGGAALVDFIPESVLTGFTAGAGILIAIMQLDEALGLSGVRGGGLIAELTQVNTRLHATGVAWPAILLTVVTAVGILAMKKWRPRLTMALVTVAAATVIAMVAGLDASLGLPVVSDRAAVPTGWPPGALPSLDLGLIQGFIGPAGAIALLGTMELAVSARKDGARPDMRREIVAQGFANIAGAFASAFPASASLTRSALLKLGGAESRLAAAVAALVVIPIMIWGGIFVAAMPQASLAGVLFVTALSMVDIKRMRRMWAASPVTRFLLVVTLFATLVLPLEWAIFAGVGLGIAHHLASGRNPRVQPLEPRGDGFVPLAADAVDTEVAVLEVSGDCHFAAAGSFLESAEKALPPKVRHVVVDLSHARAMRFAALVTMERLAEQLATKGATLHLSGVDPEFCQLLEDTGSGLSAEAYDPEPLASLRAVIARIEVADEVARDSGERPTTAKVAGHER